MKMNPVVHFEMPAENRERMAKFYTDVFGWKIQLLGKEMNNYVLATTTEIDDDGFPTSRGKINGGFFQKTEDKATHHPLVVIAVDDIKQSLKKAAKAGGKKLGEPVDILGVGLYAAFLDSEGNRVCMLQPKGMGAK